MASGVKLPAFFLLPLFRGSVSCMLFYLCLAQIILDLVLFSLIASLISSHACHLFPYISCYLINKMNPKPLELVIRQVKSTLYQRALLHCICIVDQIRLLNLTIRWIKSTLCRRALCANKICNSHSPLKLELTILQCVCSTRSGYPEAL